MKELITIATLLFITFPIFSQEVDGQTLYKGVPLTEYPPDTILINNRNYAVIITDYVPSGEKKRLKYYFIEDSLRKIRTVHPDIIKIVANNIRERDYVKINKDNLIGKEVFISVTPFHVQFSKKWKTVIDSGLENFTGVFGYKGVDLTFTSELAVVN